LLEERESLTTIGFVREGERKMSVLERE
jgi:hypothetical protein